MNTRIHIPKHVAIIPDGNRRWATEQDLKPWIGHDRGAARIQEIATCAREAGVQQLSLWGSSMENLTKRPLVEKKALLDVYDRYFDELLASPDINEFRVRIRAFGHWEEQLPGSLVQKIKSGIKATESHDGFFLNFFLAYSGDDEMIGAVNTLITSGKSKVTKDDMKQALMTAQLPPVDYMIRTGGEPHLSTGFMMWDTANAQLYFTEAFFPDFDRNAFEASLDEFDLRQRRHGA